MCISNQFCYMYNWKCIRRFLHILERHSLHLLADFGMYVLEMLFKKYLCYHADVLTCCTGCISSAVISSRLRLRVSIPSIIMAIAASTRGNAAISAVAVIEGGATANATSAMINTPAIWVIPEIRPLPRERIAVG